MTTIFSFVKKQYVFCVSTLCAAVSCFFVPPSFGYLSYIDWNTLAMLFALMAVVCGFEKCGIFVNLGNFLTSLVHNVRSLSAVLVALSFFTSMFITNDVALLTFVPFSVLLFSRQKSLPKWILLYVVVLQTIAANTGSMLTPVGNPQNIFLFSKMDVSIPAFMHLILPYSLVSALFLVVSLLFLPRTKLEFFRTAGEESAGLSAEENSPAQKEAFHDEKKIERLQQVLPLLYALMFVLCLFAVAGIIPKLALVPLTVLVLFFLDRDVLFRIDYWLLLTFCAFFVFSGNIASIPSVSAFLRKAVHGNEFMAAFLSSQLISNVPATLLLFPFVFDVSSLVVGVNAGGLGTLVASLASLISFKLYTKSKGNAGKYIAIFSVMNVLLLAIMCLLYIMIGSNDSTSSAGIGLLKK